MKTILICPEHRGTSAVFHSMRPLALMPLLGRTLLELHLMDLAAAGIQEVVVLASDRPELIRRAVGNGGAWGLSIEVIPTRIELTPDDALLLHGGRSGCDVRVMNSLPTGQPLWCAHDDTFTQLVSALADPALAESLTMKEVRPQVWISTKANVADGAKVEGPAWIGPHATVRDGAIIGPRSIIEAHAFVDEMAAIEQTWVGPSTYIGTATHLSQAFVWGQRITQWADGSTLEVRDSFVLNDLATQPAKHVSWLERGLAVVLILVTLPLALVALICNGLKGKALMDSRNVMCTGGSRIMKLHAITGAPGLLRRWPELWAVMRGELALVGNRPLTPAGATALRGEMGQLWLSVPAGVFSLADAEGDDAESVSTSLAHSVFFATQRSLGLRAQVLFHCLTHAFHPPTPTHP